MAGLGVAAGEAPKALARRAGGRHGGGGTTRSTGLHGWRSENAFYSPPPLRGRQVSVGPEGGDNRVHTRARTEDGGSKG